MKWYAHLLLLLFRTGICWRCRESVDENIMAFRDGGVQCRGGDEGAKDAETETEGLDL